MDSKVPKWRDVEYVIPTPVESKGIICIAPKNVATTTTYPTLVFDPSELYVKEQDWFQQVVETVEAAGTKKVVMFLHSALLQQKPTDPVMNFIGFVAYAAMSASIKTKKNIVFTHDGRKKLSWILEALTMASIRVEAKMIALLPGNVATPEVLCKYFAEKFERLKNVTIKTWDAKQLEADGFGLVCAIGNSSRLHKPCMIMITRKGKPGGKHICLVGKGVTFDSGGLAVKPFMHMKDQKFDKLGAVYVAAVMEHVLQDSSLQDHTFTCILPLAENSISDVAVRPGDVVRSFIGKTVEILNPDAEGRLLLADAFGYAHKLRPDVLIDVATLTAHAEKISCWHYGFYYTSNAAWKTAIEKRSHDIGERMIPMPMWDDTRKILKSEVADLVNSPLKCNDSIVAAMFLKEFVPKGAEWLHVDLAHAVKDMVPVTKGIRTVCEAIHWWLLKK